MYPVEAVELLFSVAETAWCSSGGRNVDTLFILELGRDRDIGGYAALAMVERSVKDVVAGNRQNKVGHTDMPHETDSDHEFWIMYNFMRPLSAKGAPVISMQQYADISEPIFHLDSTK